MSTQPASYTNPEWEFCDRLRKVRRSIAQLTQEEMAEAIGVTYKAYAAWESGRTKPQDIIAAAKRIADLWPGRVTAQWMLGVEDESYPPNPPTRYPVAARIQPAAVVRRLRPVAEPAAHRSDERVDDDALSWVALAEESTSPRHNAPLAPEARNTNSLLPRVDSNHQPSG